MSETLKSSFITKILSINSCLLIIQSLLFLKNRNSIYSRIRDKLQSGSIWGNKLNLGYPGKDVVNVFKYKKHLTNKRTEIAMMEGQAMV